MHTYMQYQRSHRATNSHDFLSDLHEEPQKLS